MNEEMQKYILKHFSYNKDGTISRNDRKGGLGSYDKDGYLIIKIKGKQYKAHRLVWFLNYKEFPKGEIDHINRIKTDNRIENLRIANRKLQNRNKILKKNKITGCQGIGLDRTKGLLKKYSVKIDNKTYRFYSIEEAISFRKKEGLNV